MQAISVTGLRKTFGKRKALDGIDLVIAPGEIVALIGASGSGKSTLLRHLSGFIAGDKDGGEVRIMGELIQKNGRIADDVRRVRSQIGFVFQQFNLVGRLTLLTNVLTGQLHRIPNHRSLLKLFSRQERELGLNALAEVGMGEHAFQRASTLSGGQQQRAAIARALVQGARVVLADEPIASLDPESSRKVMEILTRVNRDHGCAVLVSLHQVDVALRYCPRIVAMRDGRIVFDGPVEQISAEFLRELYCCDPEMLRPNEQFSPASDPLAMPIAA
jgi:phosphonate transport system ATP-binding protein